jgi:hypothetical protein
MLPELNPELRRNLWLQCGWQRLAGALVVGVTIAYALYAFGGFARLLFGANLAILVIFGMWGPRRAADSLAEEVGTGTWEMQRMSGLSAWSMVWGKLLGGTAFVWYCGALAVLAYVIAGQQLDYPPGRAGNFWLGVYLAVIGAALAHTTAFAIVLLLMRKTVFYRRLTITLAQTIGFFVYVVVSGVESVRLLEQVDVAPRVGRIGESEATWPLIGAILGSFLFLWAIVAAYRLMRNELQYRAWPWVWLLFLAFAIFAAERVALWPGSSDLVGIVSVPLILMLIVYAAALADPRDPIRYRSGLIALARGDLRRGLAEMPWWLSGYIVFLAYCGVMVVTILTMPQSGLPRGLLYAMLRFDIFMSFENLAHSGILLALFVLRDLLVLLCLSFGPWRHRADMTWLVYLALVYWPLAVILTFGGYLDYITLVLPVAGDNAWLNFGPITLQIAVAAIAVRHFWRQATWHGGSGLQRPGAETA